MGSGHKSHEPVGYRPNFRQKRLAMEALQLDLGRSIDH